MADGVQDDGDKSRGGRSLRDDRGMTAVEFVVLTPLLFLLLMLTVQFALFLFAKQAATAAVQAGARAAREEAATDCTSATAKWPQDAANIAVQQARQLGGQLVLNPTVTTGFTVDPNLNADCKISLVRVALHSSVTSVFPGWGLTIDVHAGGPLEQPVRHP